jgi:hypothetical protein
MPAKIPSSLASLRAKAVASCWLTSITLSTRLGSKILGRYSGLHRLIPGIEDSFVGWHPMIWIDGFTSLKYREQPMMVPVVPIDETKWVIAPAESRQISGPVVL